MTPLVEPGTPVVDPFGKPVCTVVEPVPFMAALTLAYFTDWKVEQPEGGMHIKSIPWLSTGAWGLLVHTPDGWRRLTKRREDV